MSEAPDTMPGAETGTQVNKNLWAGIYFGLWLEVASMAILYWSFILGNSNSFTLSTVGLLCGLAAMISFFVGLWKKSAPAWQLIVLGLLIFVVWPIVALLGTLGLIR